MAPACPQCGSTEITQANSLEEYADKSDTAVICGECEWFGETDDLGDAD